MTGKNLFVLEREIFWNVRKKSLYIGKGNILEYGKHFLVLEW